MCSESHLHFDYVRLAWDSGFRFEEYKTKTAFDINTIGLVDLDKVQRDRDVATVEKHIPTVLEFCLDEELSKILEPTFVKVFKMCQLSIQYLRFCKKYLDNTVVLLKKDVAHLNQENANLKSQIEDLKVDNNNISRKYTDLKETLQTLNQTVSFKCQECPKVFYSEEYLVAHVSRRHESRTTMLNTESERLQLEIKELKERLNSTEKFMIANEPNNDVTPDREKMVQEKFDQLKKHIETELSALRDENFYKNIYDKWLSEMLEKIQTESSKKVFVEQGSGDCVRVTESSTQTTASPVSMTNEETSITPIPTPRKITKKEVNEAGDCMENDVKKEAEIQIQMFENILEQKVVGSIDRLETQMSMFGKKLEDLQTQQKQVPHISDSQLSKSVDNHSTNKGVTTKNALDLRPKKQKSHVTSLQDDSPIRKLLIVRPTDIDTKNDSSETESESIEEMLEQKPKRPFKISKPIIKSNEVKKMKIQELLERSPKRIIRVASFEGSHKSNEMPVISPSSQRSHSFDSSGDNVNDRVSPIENLVKQVKTTKEKIKSPVKIMQTLDISSDSSDNSDKSSLRNTKLETKPSNISSISKRSIASLRNAIEDDELIANLKEELQEVVANRLKEIGISSQWSSVPNKTYQHASKIIAHHAAMSKKKLPNYSKVQEDILISLDKRVKENSKRNPKKHLKYSEERNSTDESRTSDKIDDDLAAKASDDSISSGKEHKATNISEKQNKKRVLFNLKSGLNGFQNGKDLKGANNAVSMKKSKKVKDDEKENRIEIVSDLDVSEIVG